MLKEKRDRNSMPMLRKPMEEVNRTSQLPLVINVGNQVMYKRIALEIGRRAKETFPQVIVHDVKKGDMGKMNVNPSSIMMERNLDKSKNTNKTRQI